MTRRRFLLPTFVLLLGFAPFVLGLVFRDEYATRQRAQCSLTLEDNFTVVRKILVQREGAKQIMELAGDSEFVRQEWSAIGGQLASLKLLDPNWQLELKGTLTVRTLDAYVGRQEVELDQTVNINADQVESHVQLRQPAGRLRNYVMTTRFSRTADEQTQVELSLEQEIMTDAPWFAHAIADSRVLASVEKTLLHQQAGIRQFVAGNRNKVPRFPLR